MKNRTFRSKTSVFIWMALIGLILAICFDFIDCQFSFHDILVEFHGLVFDLFIFGILITIYEDLITTRETVTRYKEEINDYRFLKNEEAMFRIRGLVKRLVEFNEKNIDLSHCFLNTDKSFEAYKDMRNWKFAFTSLIDTSFFFSNMENARFYSSNLMNARFQQVNLTNCDFDSANLYNTEFKDCILNCTKFTNAFVNNKNWFEVLESKNNKGVNFLREIYELKEEFSDEVNIIIYRIIKKQPRIQRDLSSF